VAKICHLVTIGVPKTARNFERERIGRTAAATT
jgi:hypothetical protein